MISRKLSNYMVHGEGQFDRSISYTAEGAFPALAKATTLRQEKWPVVVVVDGDGRVVDDAALKRRVTRIGRVAPLSGS